MRTRGLTLATAEIQWLCCCIKLGQCFFVVAQGEYYITLYVQCNNLNMINRDIYFGCHRSIGACQFIAVLDGLVLNVFNNHKELDSGTGNLNLLKGTRGRSDIKMPSLFRTL